MNKKNFKNPAAAFISETEQEEINIEEVDVTKQNTQELSTEEPNIKLPIGYVVGKESKSVRMQLLIRPATKKAIKAASIYKDMSMNDLINQILEDYLRKGNYYND